MATIAGPRTGPAIPWHGNDPVLSWLGTARLLASGVVNACKVKDENESMSTPPKSPWSALFTEPVTSARELRRMIGINSGLLHPIFRRQNWILGDGEFDLILPSLCLTTLLLEDSSILPFIRGFLHKPLQRLDDERAERKYRQELYVFDWRSSNQDPHADQLDAWKSMAGLRRRIHYRFYPTKAYGETDTTDGPDPTLPTIRVTLNPGYLRALRRIRQLRHFPSTKKFSDPDALLRTRFHLAITLCHEVCHALGTAADITNTFHPDYHTGMTEWAKTHDRLPLEPFYRDYRISELGATFESVLFSGLIRPLATDAPAMADFKHLVIPYGFGIIEFPGAQGGALYADKERGTPGKWGVQSTWYAAIPMDYVWNMFSDRFWNEHVARANNVTALHPERLHEVRLMQRRDRSPSESPGLHQDRYLPGEMPRETFRRPWVRTLARERARIGRLLLQVTLFSSRSFVRAASSVFRFLRPVLMRAPWVTLWQVAASLAILMVSLHGSGILRPSKQVDVRYRSDIIRQWGERAAEQEGMVRPAVYVGTELNGLLQNADGFELEDWEVAEEIVCSLDWG
ncbi:hypothetical protein MBLNU459_g0411t1 [Dothideomycetes sp. NU459]